MENETITPQNESSVAEHEELHEHTVTTKKSQKLVTGVFIVFVIAVIAGLAYYFGAKNSVKMVPPTEPTPAPSSAPTETSAHPDWKTFGDSTLSIQVPPDFSEISESAPSQLEGPSPILSLSSNKHDYFAPNYNQESVIVISRITDTANCLKPAEDNLEAKGDKTINGNTFSVFTSADAGAGNRYYTTIYRTLHDESCTEIAHTIHTSTDGINIDLQAVDASVSTAEKLFDEILTTFKFTN